MSQRLPLPDTLAGFAELSGNDWRTLAPFLATLLTILVLTASTLSPAPKAKQPCVPHHPVLVSDFSAASRSGGWADGPRRVQQKDG